MSQAAALGWPVASNRPIAVSFRFLLALYVVLPVAVALALLDMTVLHQQLYPVLKLKPVHWVGYLFLFNWPHIFASQFSLFDREYLDAYRAKIRIGVPLVLVGSLLAFRMRYGLTDFVFDIVTLYHVLFQQLGIARTMLREIPRSYEWWKWTGLVIFVLTSRMVYDSALWIRAIPILLALAITPLAARTAQAAISPVGRDYVWANQAMLVGIAVFGLTQYYGLAVIVPRIVHDITGFTFYVAHDATRNTDVLRNDLFRFTARLGMPPAFAGPALALAANCVFVTAGWTVRYFPVFAAIGFVHYYTEGIIWKRHTVHRRHIAFAP